jgi:hypothetical protein
VIAAAEANAAEAANALGSGLDEVQASASRARGALAGSFDQQIRDAIAQIADPTGQAFDQLIASQQKRLADAQAVQANIDQVNAPVGSGTAAVLFQGLSPDQLGGLGSSRGLTGNGAYGAAVAALHSNDNFAGSFDQQIRDAIAQIADPTGLAFDQLIASQQKRLADAQAVQANIDQVTRLADLELQKFFSGLSPDQLVGLGSSRSLTGNGAYGAASAALQSAADAAADAAARALQAANDNAALKHSFDDLGTSVKDLTDQAQNAAQAASNAASDWGRAYDALSRASSALLISDQALSPGDRYRNAASQFASLRGAALGGNVGAASDVAGFASEYLKSSFSFNGSTAAYGSDRAYVQDTLNSLAGFSQGQQTLAQQQANSAAQAVTLLSAIKQAISEKSDNTNEELAALRKDFADLASQMKTANLQARFA